MNYELDTHRPSRHRARYHMSLDLGKRYKVSVTQYVGNEEALLVSV